MAYKMINSKLVEESDRWVLPLLGYEVARFSVDYALELDLAKDDHRFVIHIGTALSYKEGDVTYDLTLNHLTDMGKVFSIFGKTLISAVALKTGELQDRK